MDIDRKLAAELAVSGAAVVAFIGAASYVSQSFATPGNATGNATSPTIGPEGGLAMIGVIALFVVLMAGAGLVLYRLDFDEE